MLQSSHMFRFPSPDAPLGKPLRALVGAVLAGFFFIFGYALGQEPGGLSSVLGLGQVQGTHGEAPAWIDDDVDFEMFWDVWDLVQAQYVDQPTSDKDLFYGALEGLVWGLDDPYSTFFTPQLAEEFNQELSGKFFGIGAEIGLDDQGGIVVVAPLADTPADRAGVLAGDRILLIDDLDTFGMTVNEAVSKIRGDKGTTVTLTMGRADQEPIKIPIVRDEIKIDSVKWNVREDGIGVVSISVFNEDTPPLFAQAVREIQDQGVDQVIIDLRNNPGGLLDAAIVLAGYWVGDDVVVIEDTGEDREELFGQGLPLLSDTQTVVLVNGGSASASEILAGALQDYGKATVIGEQTFGKGSVQQYHDLPDGSAVKITVARWLTPLGRSIDKEGIAPDQEVAYSLDEEHADTDAQLQAAVDFLATQ
jgi:carboxyl-terminal processing protease